MFLLLTEYKAHQVWSAIVTKVGVSLLLFFGGSGPDSMVDLLSHAFRTSRKRKRKKRRKKYVWVCGGLFSSYRKIPGFLCGQSPIPE